MSLGSIGSSLGSFFSHIGSDVKQAGSFVENLGQAAAAVVPNLSFHQQQTARDTLGGALGSIAGGDGANDGSFDAARHVYVLFDGLGSEGSQTANNEAQTLEQHGIKASDIVEQSSPFPQIHGATDLVKNLGLYEQAANPNSNLSRTQEKSLESQLSSHGVTPKDDLVFIGDSAGGQEAATQSALIEKDTGDHVGAVVSMGTPFTTNYTPTDVRQVVAESQGDPVLNLTDRLPLGTSRIPPGYNNHANRKHIQLPALNAQGGVNDHGSYLQPANFWQIVSTANDSSNVDHAPWTDARAVA